MKRKCSAKQLKALARGRRIRKANLRKKKGNLRKKKGFGQRRSLKRRRSTTKLKSPRKKKRSYRRADSMSSLTGGTRDVNPQFLNVHVKQTVENTTQYWAFTVPISRTPSAGNRTTVMEILKIGFMFDIFNKVPVPIGGACDSYAALMIGDQTVKKPFHHWSVLAAKYHKIHASITPPDTYVLKDEMPWWFDITDGAGHGVLVATDSMTLLVLTTGWEATHVQGVECKILYRFKRVGMAEYIGIVQSQQGK